MNINELLQALQYSVGKTQEEVRLAEQYLLQAKTSEGFIPNLLLIACNKEVNLYVRQAAIILLKSIVQEGWNKSTDNNKSIPVADKETLRNSILEAIIKCADTPKIYRQMEEVIKCIGRSDFPETWKSILPNVMELLKNSNKFAEILGALLTLKNLIANYKFVVEEEREFLELICTNTFPLLEVYAKNLLDNYTEETAIAMHVILKTIFASMQTDLPKYFFDEKIMESWMTFFKLIIDKSLGSELESQTDNQTVISQRARHVFWLNKKNALRILATWLLRYTLYKPTKKANKYSVISQLFVDKYSVSFLESCVKILYKRKEQYVPVKVLYFAMKFIFRSMSFNNLNELLANHLEPLLFEYFIPVMFLTVDDDDDWNNNPIEFVRKEDDANERPNNIKSAAKDFFITICAKDSFAPDEELFLLKFMKYAAHVLTNNVDPRTNQQTDLRMKEALMHIIGLLKSPIISNTYLKDNMEFLLEKYVLPELKNQIGFLRYRACWLVGIYGGLRYKKTENISVAVEGLYNCLQDNEFAVRVKAGIAMSSLLRQPEAIEILKPGLQKILQIYISLIDMMGNDELVVAFEGIIGKFEDDIHPYAIELVEHLTKTFFKVHHDNQDDDGADSDDDGAEQTEKGFAANEYLSAIARIISCELNTETVVKLEEIVLPIIEFILTEEGMDCIEPGIEVLVELLYSQDTISEKIWAFYPELNYIVAGRPDALIRDNFSHLSAEKQELMKQQAEGWAYEFIDSIIPCFQNYIQKGKTVLFNARDPHFNITYLELLLKSIERIYQLSVTKGNFVEPTLVTVLFSTILENYPKQVNDLVPYIIDKVIAYASTESMEFKKALVEAVAMCFWYDAELTFQTLESKGVTENIFKGWVEILPEYNQDWDCQRNMFGLASIFKLNVSSIPQIVITSLPGILKEMIKLSTKILDLRNLNEGDAVEDTEDDDTEKKTLEKLKMINQKNDQQEEDDGDVDDDDFNDLDTFEPNVKGQYSSPIEDNCEILFMKECLTVLQQNQTDAYNQLISCLSEEEQKTLRENIQEAEEQQLEFEKFKQEEQQKREMKALNRA